MGKGNQPLYVTNAEDGQREVKVSQGIEQRRFSFAPFYFSFLVFIIVEDVLELISAFEITKKYLETEENSHSNVPRRNGFTKRKERNLLRSN